MICTTIIVLHRSGYRQNSILVHNTCMVDATFNNIMKYIDPPVYYVSIGKT